MDAQGNLEKYDIDNIAKIMTAFVPESVGDDPKLFQQLMYMGLIDYDIDGWLEVTPEAVAKYPLWAEIDGIVRDAEKKNIAIAQNAIDWIKGLLRGMDYAMNGYDDELETVYARNETNQYTDTLIIRDGKKYPSKIRREYKDGRPMTIDTIKEDNIPKIERMIYDTRNKIWELNQAKRDAIRKLADKYPITKA